MDSYTTEAVLDMAIQGLELLTEALRIAHNKYHIESLEAKAFGYVKEELFGKEGV